MRAAECRREAQLAMEVSVQTATVELKIQYLQIATEFLKVADEIEQLASRNRTGATLSSAG